MASQNKLTSQLEESLSRAHDKDMLDIVVELNPETNKEILSQTKNLSRQERITALQENFEHNSAPVVSTIAETGGEVVGKAWINQTLKARVPVESVKEISEHDEVVGLDLPEAISADN